MNILINVIISLVALKAILGYNFPWEKCSCCGKKYRDHKQIVGIDTTVGLTKLAKTMEENLDIVDEFAGGAKNII